MGTIYISYVGVWGDHDTCRASTPTKVIVSIGEFNPLVTVSLLEEQHTSRAKYTVKLQSYKHVFQCMDVFSSIFAFAT